MTLPTWICRRCGYVMSVSDFFRPSCPVCRRLGEMVPVERQGSTIRVKRPARYGSDDIGDRPNYIGQPADWGALSVSDVLFLKSIGASAC